MIKLNILKKIWTPFTKSSAGAYASAACYYLLLSLPPTTMLTIRLLPLFSDSRQSILSLLQTTVPVPFYTLAEAVVQFAYNHPSSGLISLSSLAAVWSSAKGTASILEGFHAVLDLPKSNFIKRRFRAIFLFWGFFIAVVIAALLLGAVLILLIASTRLFLPASKRMAHYTLERLFSFLLLTLLFSAVYSFFCRSAKFRHIITAALSASVVVTGLSVFFSIYIRISFNRDSPSPGSGLLFAGMLWLRTMILVLLYGAILCKLLAEDSYHPAAIIKKAIRTPKS